MNIYELAWVAAFVAGGVTFIVLHVSQIYRESSAEAHRLEAERHRVDRHMDAWEELAESVAIVSQAAVKVAGARIGPRRAAPELRPTAEVDPVVELYDDAGGILFPGRDHPGSPGSGSAATEKMARRRKRRRTPRRRA